jgi:site-specific DNA-cytosine methylase
VADPRADGMLYSPVPEGVDPREYFAKYDVRGWEQPARTVAGSGTNGGYAVADPLARAAEAALIKCTPRNGAYGVMSWTDAARTITGVSQIDNSTVAVADPRKAPPELIVIISEDGCWHRPITPLELAALQGLPHDADGRAARAARARRMPRWRERIGNAVPPCTRRRRSPSRS